MKKSLLLFCMLLFICFMGCSVEIESVEWSSITLSELLPKPESDKIEILTEEPEWLYIYVHEMSGDDYKEYVLHCKNDKGFTYDIGDYENSFFGYNRDGYYLSLHYDDFAEKMMVDLNAPREKNDEEKEASESAPAITQQEEPTADPIIPTDNPTQEYIISCLLSTPNIIEAMAVTEDNDPNDKLGEEGGYYAAVFFSVDLLKQDDIYGDNLIDKGTDAGGCIEAYKTVEDAEARNKYLAKYDDSWLFNSGYHTVVGTMVVRTSKELNEDEQKILEENIIAVLESGEITEDILTPSLQPTVSSIPTAMSTATPKPTNTPTPALTIVLTPTNTPKPTTTSTPTPTYTPTPTTAWWDRPAVTATPIPSTEVSNDEEIYVWISTYGSKYHSNPECSGMKKPSQITLAKAKSKGLKACEKCGSAIIEDSTELREEALICAKKIYAAYLDAERTWMKEWLTNVEGYSEVVAQYAVENCSSDWSDKALYNVNEYFDDENSYPAMVTEDLLSRGFTSEEITYAINNCDIDWNACSLNLCWRVDNCYTPNGYIEELITTYGFEKENAEYGVKNCDIDWLSRGIEYVSEEIIYKSTGYSYCNEHGGYASDTGRCSLCGSYSTSGGYFIPYSIDGLVEVLKEVGFIEDIATEIADGYDDRMYGHEDERYTLAYVSLEGLIVENTNNISRSECTKRLKEWGYSDAEIEYAHSKFENYHFSGN